MNDKKVVLVDSPSPNAEPISKESGSHPVDKAMGSAGGVVTGVGDHGPEDPWTDARDATRDTWLRVRTH
jgi:hypothetical protein